MGCDQWRRFGRTELVREPDHGVWELCFSPDSQTLACGNGVGRRGNQTLFFAAATGELRRWDEDSYTTGLAFSPDGKMLAQAGAGVIRLRNVVTGKPALSAPGLPHYVMSVRLAPDGKTLMASCWGGQTGLWDALTGKPLAPFRALPQDFAGHADMLLGTALTGDGKKAALVDAKGVLHVWEPTIGKALCRIADPPVGEDQADFSADGKLLVVKHKDHVIRIWDTETGRLSARCRSSEWSDSLIPTPFPATVVSWPPPHPPSIRTSSGCGIRQPERNWANLRGTTGPHPPVWRSPPTAKASLRLTAAMIRRQTYRKRTSACAFGTSQRTRIAALQGCG